MTYAVGTHISFSNTPQCPPKSRLRLVGERIVFVLGDSVKQPVPVYVS